MCWGGGAENACICFQNPEQVIHFSLVFTECRASREINTLFGMACRLYNFMGFLMRVFICHSAIVQGIDPFLSDSD